MSDKNNELEVVDVAAKEPLTLSNPNIRELDLKTFAFSLLKPLIEKWLLEQLASGQVAGIKAKAVELFKTRAKATTPEIEAALNDVIDFLFEEAAEWLVAKLNKLLK